MAEIEVRPLRTPVEMNAASTVYQRAFGYAPGDAAVPPKLLLTLSQHGGLVLGALRGPDLVGFSYAFLARDPGTPDELYLFSQSTAILPEAQDLGLGRALKWAQRDRALALGIDTIRWTYDPMRTRNAHLNLDVLGATAATLLPDYYGADTVGRDTGVSSDRLLVDWSLTAAPRSPVPPPADTSGAAPGELVGDWLVVPADWDGYRAAAGREAAQRVRLAVRDGLGSAFAAGRRAVSCQRLSAGLAAYHLV